MGLGSSDPHSTWLEFSMESGTQSNGLGAPKVGRAIQVHDFAVDSCENPDLVVKEGECGSSLAPFDGGGALVCVDSSVDGFGAESLAVCPPLKGQEDCHPILFSSAWVLDMVSSFKDLVGLSCDGYENELMALFSILEKDRGNSGVVTPGKSSGKFLRELKGLKSSINYEGKKYESRKSRKGGSVLIKSL